MIHSPQIKVRTVEVCCVDQWRISQWLARCDPQWLLVDLDRCNLEREVLLLLFHFDMCPLPKNKVLPSPWHKGWRAILIFRVKRQRGQNQQTSDIWDENSGGCPRVLYGPTPRRTLCHKWSSLWRVSTCNTGREGACETWKTVGRFLGQSPRRHPKRWKQNIPKLLVFDAWRVVRWFCSVRKAGSH